MQKSPSGDVLSLENVVKTYPGNTKRALDRVSFSVGAGEFFSILGPSGSGKTTILRTIAGFEKPDEGRVVMSGTSRPCPRTGATFAPCFKAMPCFHT